jgi:hypothetical protein
MKLGTLALIAAGAVACSDAALGEPADEAREPAIADELATLQAPLAATVTIVARVQTSNDVATPGILVELSGTAQRSARTDANGMVRFDVPAGAYSLRPQVLQSRRMSPEVININASNNRFESFECTGSCNGTTAVDAGKSIMIVHPSVITDARAQNAASGAWSFRFMLEQMLPEGADVAAFARDWLSGFDSVTELNGFAVDERNIDGLLGMWPTTEGGQLDLAQAPFRLLAIANRVDLHKNTNGELRFVYGLVDPSGSNRLMTVIFEFELPARDANTGASLNRKSWVNKFQALRDVAFGPTYNQQLQALTDLVTRRGTMPAKPGGNAIGQVRTNEIETSGPWQLREFHLQETGGGLALRLAGTGQTPADEHVIPGTPEHQALADYINANAVAIRGGFAEVPASLIGGQSTEVEPWQFAVPVDEPARLSFAGQTCNGCHSVETANLQREGFYHVSPVADGGADGTGRLSDLVKLFEIPRRAAFMQNQIACTGSACAPAAELVFF